MDEEKVGVAPAVAKLIIEIDFDAQSFDREGILIEEEMTEALYEVEDEVIAGIDEGDTQGIITDDYGNVSWKWRLVKVDGYSREELEEMSLADIRNVANLYTKAN